jgi:probable lipoprotein NlpC
MQELITELIGTEFKDRGRDLSGVDCWGLVILVYRKLFGLTIIDPDVSAMDSQEAADHFLEQSLLWKEIPIGLEKMGDVVLFRDGRFVSHAGIVVKLGLMLHTRIDLPTCIEHYDSGVWKTRLSGIFRHAELA